MTDGSWAERARATAATAKDELERRRRHAPVDAAVRIYERDAEIAGSVLGSALALRLFLFFVPLLLFLVGAGGQIAEWVGPDSVVDATAVGGTAREQISAALDQSGRARWFAAGIGLVGMLTAGRTLSKTAVAASALAWQLPTRSRASARSVGSFVGLIGSIGLVAAVVNRIRAELGVAVAGVSFLAAVVVYLVGWALVMLLLPRASADPSVVLPGAALVAVVTVAMQLVSQLYLPDRISGASDLYGTFGAAVTTLGWFFFLGRAVVTGMVVNAVLHERFGTVASGVLGLPVVRILGRRLLPPDDEG